MKSPRADGASKNPCILIVEDDDPVRRSLQLLLRGRGYDVRAYASARQALADPHNRSAVCLIADLVMPDLDGIALLDGLRADGWKGRAVLVSGFLTEESQERALRAGFEAVLPKPVADSALMNAVLRALPNSRTEKP